MQLPKDLELSMRYLQEIIRNGKSEMYFSAMNEVIDSLISFLKVSVAEYDKEAAAKVNNAMQELIKWIDDHVIGNLMSQKPSSSQIYDNSEGLAKLTALEQALIMKKPQLSEDNSADRSSSCSDSGVDAENTTPTESKKSKQFFNSNDSNFETDDTLSDLLQQLQLR